MAEFEQDATTQSHTLDTKETVREATTIPIAPANHYLLLFALLLPYALGSIFNFFNQDIENIATLLQLKLLSFGILLLCLIPFAKRLFQNIRFKTAPSSRTILWALLYNFLAVAGTNLFIQAFFPEWLELAPSFTQASSWDLLLLPIAIAIIVPLEEELVFRGILLNSYERLLSPRNAFFAVSLFFALVHVVPAQTIGILPTCFIITRAVQYSNSIWTGVIIHMVVNGLASMAMLLPAPEDLEGVVNSEFTVSPIVGLLGLLLAANMLWIAYRKWGLDSTDKPENNNEVFWTMSLIIVVGICALGMVVMMVNPIP